MMNPVYPKPKLPKRLGSLFLRNIPAEVRDQFKAYCARRGVSMTRVLVDYMRELIDQDAELNLQKNRKKKKGGKRP